MVGTMLLAGCSLYKPYEAKLEVPNDIMGPISQPGDTVSMGTMGWREMFTDSLLQQLIVRGLANNTDVQAAQKTIEQAQNDLRAVAMGNLPILSFEPVGGLHHFDKVSSYPYQFPVVATWQLNIFGQQTSKKRQQQARREMYRDYRQAVEASLVANIASTYYSLVLLDRKLQIMCETEVVWEKSLESMRTLYEAGLYYSPAVYQMEASLLSVRSGIVELRENILDTEAALCLLLSEAPHHIERSPYGTFHMPERISVGVPLQLLALRPDVRQAERNMEIAYYDTQQARQSFYPDIVITAGAGWSNENGTVNPGKMLFEAIASLTQPLFAQGKLRARYKNAQLEQEKAQLQFSQTLLNAGNEVYRYLHLCHMTQQKAGYLRQMVTSLNEAYEGTQELMDNGTNTYVEVLKAQEDLLKAQLSETENHILGIQALINLYTALGGCSFGAWADGEEE